MFTRKFVSNPARPTSRPTTPTRSPQDSDAGLSEDKGKLKTAKGDYTVRVTEGGGITKPVDHTQSHGAAKKDLRGYNVRSASGEQEAKLKGIDEKKNSGHAEPGGFFASNTMVGDVTGAVGHSPKTASTKQIKTKQKLPKKKLTKEELEAQKKEKQARLGHPGQKITARERENYLHNLGMKASLDPSKSWRTLAQRGPTMSPPKGVESLQDRAASVYINEVTKSRGTDAAQEAIDQATADMELARINAITNPAQEGIKTKQKASSNKKSTLEKPNAVTISEAEIGKLRDMARANPKLTEVLETAAVHGYGAGNVDGQVSLIIGGMAYPVEGQIDLLHQLFCNDKKRIIFGWCVGNKRHNKPEALTRTLVAHKPLLGGRMSVHSAAYQADWNPELIQDHFGDSVDPVKVKKCAENRVADAKSYISQAHAQGVGLDTMLKETMEGKEAHVREFGKEVTAIIEELKTSPDAQKLLAQRVTLTEDFAKHVNYPGHRKAVLDEQLKEFCNLADRNYGAGTDKARRAELAFHSMSVLEGVAAECIKQDPDTMRYLFSPASEAGFNQPFYRALFGAVGDPKSIKYMGAQEHEFERFSDKHNLIYVYSAEVGPFLTGSSKPRVQEMRAKPFNITGMPVSTVLP